MKSRIAYARVAPGIYEATDALDRYVQTCDLERAPVPSAVPAGRRASTSGHTRTIARV